MISFNQHVLLRGGVGEVLWLNEGLSHYAEELGGRSYALTPDGIVTDCPAGSVECQFYRGDLRDAYEYMDTVTKHFLLPTAGIGSLAERGAAWLFVRYVVDQYSAGSTRPDWNVVTRALDGTAQTGAQNVAAVTGVPFETVVTRWALAIYVTDRGGTPPELQYVSWDLHAVYAQLHGRAPDGFPKTYPLVPLQFVGRYVAVTGTLRAGSGIYFRLTQPAADPGFTLSFTGTNGLPIAASFVPRVSVMRLLAPNAPAPTLTCALTGRPPCVSVKVAAFTVLAFSGSLSCRLTATLVATSLVPSGGVTPVTAGATVSGANAVENDVELEASSGVPAALLTPVVIDTKDDQRSVIRIIVNVQSHGPQMMVDQFSTCDLAAVA
jgi:uncharacterized protein YodC (DUF2158 family)